MRAYLHWLLWNSEAAARFRAFESRFEEVADWGSAMVAPGVVIGEVCQIIWGCWEEFAGRGAAAGPINANVKVIKSSIICISPSPQIYFISVTKPQLWATSTLLRCSTYLHLIDGSPMSAARQSLMEWIENLLTISCFSSGVAWYRPARLFFVVGWVCCCLLEYNHCQ